MEWLLGVVEQYGYTAALVCFIIWDSRNREGRYISIIEKQAKSQEAIKRDIEFIKVYMRDGGEK